MSGVGAAIGGGLAAAGAIGSAVISSKAAGKAANAQEQAAQDANQTQLTMYNQTRADQAPWRAAGANALGALQSWYGLGGTNPAVVGHDAATAHAAVNPNVSAFRGGTPQLDANGQPIAPTMSTAAQGMPPSGPSTATGDADQKLIESLPGYQFNMDQGNAAVQKNLAASGLLDSGAAQKALTQYGQGYATNAANQYLNGLQSLAGLGQTSTAQTGAIGANAANQIGAGQIYSGNAQASGYANQSNAINAGLSGLTGIYSNYNTANRINPGYGGPTSGYEAAGLSDQQTNDLISSIGNMNYYNPGNP